MDIDTAPTADGEDDDDVECDNCAGGTYVLYDGDKLCRDCGYIAGSGGGSREREVDDWAAWQQHRREHEDYSGFHGPDRIKMVGGFASAYDFGADFER